MPQYFSFFTLPAKPKTVLRENRRLWQDTSELNLHSITAGFNRDDAWMHARMDGFSPTNRSKSGCSQHFFVGNWKTSKNKWIQSGEVTRRLGRLAAKRSDGKNLPASFPTSFAWMNESLVFGGLLCYGKHYLLAAILAILRFRDLFGMLSEWKRDPFKKGEWGDLQRQRGFQVWVTAKESRGK